MKRWFHRIVLTRRWVAFLVMGLAFFGFGAGTLNLFMLVKANVELLAAHGWLAVMDGGLRQLVELLLTGYASMLCYVVFKACEYSLVRHLADMPSGSSSSSVPPVSALPSAASPSRVPTSGSPTTPAPPPSPDA